MVSHARLFSRGDRSLKQATGGSTRPVPICKTRSKRPSQLPPLRSLHRAACPSSLPPSSPPYSKSSSEAGGDDDLYAYLEDSEDEVREEVPPSEEGSSSRTPPPRCPTYSERKATEDANWRRKIPALRVDIIRFSPQRQQWRCADEVIQVERLQQRLAAGWQQHACCHHADGTCDQRTLVVQQSRSVKYWSLYSHGLLIVPHYTCSTCHSSFSPSPVQVGCFPSSPVVAEAWFDMQLLETFSHVGVEQGLSATGFCSALNQLQASEEASSAQLEIKSFLSAFFAFTRTTATLNELHSLGVQGLDSGPFHGCPICSPAADHEESAGYAPSLAADAVTKLGHHSHCGRGCSTLAPHLSAHFTEPDADVQQRFSAGKLTLKACMADRPERVEGVASDGEDEAAACTSALSCSRPDSHAKGVCDIHGLVGAVCAHTIPLLGAFMDLRTPEQFIYYLILLQWMLVNAPQLRDVYIDFGCRLSKTWARYSAGLPSALLLRIMVNWMHAKGHEEACEVVNSARHHLGAARRVGENVEQLWSMLKCIGGLVRYMTLAHRRDFIEAALLMISMRKRLGMVKHLKHRYDEVIRLTRTCRVDLAKVILDAGVSGVWDMPAARRSFLQHVAGSCSMHGSDWEVDYVHLLHTLAALRSASVSSKAYVVLSSAMAGCLAKVATPAAIKKVEAKLVLLELAHKICPWDRWEPSMVMYQAALKRLRLREVDRCRIKIWALVLNVKQLRAEREREGTSNKETKRLDSKGQRKRAVIKDLLQEMYIWDCIDSDLTPDAVAYSEEIVKGMFKGILPWMGDGVSEAAALAVHHGRMFHSAQSDLDRTVEEEVVLRVEKLRLLRWLKVCSQGIEAALLELRTACPEGAAGGMNVPLTVNAGQAFLLVRWQQRIKHMEVDAHTLLAHIQAPEA